MNEYEPLKSVFDAFRSYLNSYPSEVIVATLKIDDWCVCKTESDRVTALSILNDLIGCYKIYRKSDMPNLRDVRGYIYLINRINDSLTFGVPVDIADAYKGNYLPRPQNRHFDAYVQDKWNIKSANLILEKLDLVFNAISLKRSQDGKMNLNFASANHFLMGVYVMRPLLERFGEKTTYEGRYWKLGWILFDYGFRKVNTDVYGYIDVIEFVIDSNFNYGRFSSKFTTKNY